MSGGGAESGSRRQPPQPHCPERHPPRPPGRQGTVPFLSARRPSPPGCPRSTNCCGSACRSGTRRTGNRPFSPRNAFLRRLSTAGRSPPSRPGSAPRAAAGPLPAPDRRGTGASVLRAGSWAFVSFLSRFSVQPAMRRGGICRPGSMRQRQFPPYASGGSAGLRVQPQIILHGDRLARLPRRSDHGGKISASFLIFFRTSLLLPVQAMEPSGWCRCHGCPCSRRSFPTFRQARITAFPFKANCSTIPGNRSISAGVSPRGSPPRSYAMICRPALCGAAP